MIDPSLPRGRRDNQNKNIILKCGKRFGSGGIRTHALERTGALNQRLRPLGHATPCALNPAACLTCCTLCSIPTPSQQKRIDSHRCTAWHQCLRPYHVESTSSRPITEVKQHWAKLVLGWVTAWEYLVSQAFTFFSIPSKKNEIMHISWQNMRQPGIEPGHAILHAFVLPVCQCFSLRIFIFCISFLPHIPYSNVYGHTMLKAPVLVRSLKLSNIGPSQYLDG